MNKNQLASLVRIAKVQEDQFFQLQRASRAQKHIDAYRIAVALSNFVARQYLVASGRPLPKKVIS